MLTGNEHDHTKEEDSHETVEVVSTVEDVGVSPEHDHSGLEGLWDVMFGFEHVIAEFFWNGVFILATYLFTRAVALRKIHKYVDDKHGVKHEDY